MTTDDNELMRLLFRTGHGDQAAFAALYEQTSARLHSVCLYLLGRREDAEEALQEAYVRIWHQAGSYSPARGSVLTWMISIARYRAIDLMRRRGRRRENVTDDLDAVPEGALADDARGPQEFSALANDAGALAYCMDTLSDDQRQAIRLAFLEGLTHSELCDRLGSPLGSIKSWIRRGLQALKRCLQG
ncbi:MAG: sigma-70 family RNA polymerase sigma factor [Halofilum sp. (in: g-proteobacteria)]